MSEKTMNGVLSGNEAKELQKRKKDAAFHASKNYFLILVVVLAIVYIVDELASNVRGSVGTYIVCDLYNVVFDSQDSTAYDNASATLGTLTLVAYLSYLVAPFYKSLADKYGRKLFLVINTIGMGVGMLICILAHSPIVYVLGCVVLTFFTPNDMQVIYIMECAPKQHRAKLCSITKGIALISVSSIGILVKLFVNEKVPSTWRYVFILPIILALVIGIAAIFFVRETPIFTQERIEYLESSEEEREQKRQQELADKKAEEQKPGVGAAFKYIFKHKQTRAIALVALLFAFATGYTEKYEAVIEAAIQAGKLVEDAKATILIIYPLVNGVFSIISGFLIDHFGRKEAALILGAQTAIGYGIFAVGTTLGLNPYLTAFGYGFSIAGLWSVSDMIYFVITSESTPTEMRSSVVGCMQLVGMVGTGLNMAFNIFSTVIFGSMNLGIVLAIAYLPMMIIALLILFIRVKETKDVDLDHVSIE